MIQIWYKVTSEAERLSKIEERLKNGEKLSEEEIQEMKAYISGLRASAEFLVQTAENLESLLNWLD